MMTPRFTSKINNKILQLGVNITCDLLRLALQSTGKRKKPGSLGMPPNCALKMCLIFRPYLPSTCAAYFRILCEILYSPQNSSHVKKKVLVSSLVFGVTVLGYP